MRSAVLGCLLMVAGCGKTEEPDGDPVSFAGGTRLHARVLVSEDGEGVAKVAAQPIPWHDDDLDVDCAFSQGVDGTYRCYPVEEVLQVMNPGAECDPSQHVAILPTGGVACTERYAAKRYWNSDCLGGQPAVGFRLGATEAHGGLQQYAHLVDYSAGGECVENPFGTGFGDVVYPSCHVEVVSDDVFVSASEEVREVGEIRQHVLHGEDGSFQNLGLRHPELGVELYPDRGELVPSLTSFRGTGFTTMIGTTSGGDASRSSRQPATSGRNTSVSASWISTSVANHQPPGPLPPGRRSYGPRRRDKRTWARPCFPDAASFSTSTPSMISWWRTPSDLRAATAKRSRPRSTSAGV